MPSVRFSFRTRTHHWRAPKAARATLRTIPLFLLGFVPILAQAPQNPNAQGVIRITATLVRVGAVVTDAKGHQVTNLRRGGFEVREGGRLGSKGFSQQGLITTIAGGFGGHGDP